MDLNLIRNIILLFDLFVEKEVTPLGKVTLIRGQQQVVIVCLSLLTVAMVMDSFLLI